MAWVSSTLAYIFPIPSPLSQPAYFQIFSICFECRFLRYVSCVHTISSRLQAISFLIAAELFLPALLPLVLLVSHV